MLLTFANIILPEKQQKEINRIPPPNATIPLVNPILRTSLLRQIWDIPPDYLIQVRHDQCDMMSCFSCFLTYVNLILTKKHTKKDTSSKCSRTLGGPHTSTGRKFALVESLSHDLVCAGSIYHVHFAWQVWHGQYSPGFKLNKLKSFPRGEIDQNHVYKKDSRGKGFAVRRLSKHNFCPASALRHRCCIDTKVFTWIHSA